MMEMTTELEKNHVIGMAFLLIIGSPESDDGNSD